MEIGKAIKKLRKDVYPQLNQAEYASIINITQSYLSQIENGKKKPSMEIIELISESLEVPLPIMLWFSLEEKDVSEDKKEHFLFLKPSMDKMIDSIFDFNHG